MKKIGKHSLDRPFNDFVEPEHETTFQEFNEEAVREIWRGRASLAELPEGPSAGGAGGNADLSGDPIDTYHEKHRGSVLITGPDGATGKKGSIPHA